MLSQLFGQPGLAYAKWNENFYWSLVLLHELVETFDQYAKYTASGSYFSFHTHAGRLFICSQLWWI